MAATDIYRSKTIGFSPRLTAAMHYLFQSVALWNDRRATNKELNALSDHALDDIGLSRGDILKLTS